jgi:hypothetical protein
MRIYFLKDFDIHKKGEDKFLEPSLARRFCQNEVAIPYVTHLENERLAQEAAKGKKAKELAAKKDAAAPKKRATSTRASTRKKAVK